MLELSMASWHLVIDGGVQFRAVSKGISRSRRTRVLRLEMRQDGANRLGR